MPKIENQIEIEIVPGITTALSDTPRKAIVAQIVNFWGS